MFSSILAVVEWWWQCLKFLLGQTQPQFQFLRVQRTRSDRPLHVTWRAPIGSAAGPMWPPRVNIGQFFSSIAVNARMHTWPFFFHLQDMVSATNPWRAWIRLQFVSPFNDRSTPSLNCTLHDYGLIIFIFIINYYYSFSNFHKKYYTQ